MQAPLGVFERMCRKIVSNPVSYCLLKWTTLGTNGTVLVFTTFHALVLDSGARA